MLHTHKCYINIAIARTCIRQPFTISYMLKFICMLNAIAMLWKVIEAE
ncbi:hypothetical protein T09_13166 [Trichinella sp. T9]|nr:hypothetical protein T09_13166 [Trichinella sp. T9]